MLHKQNYTLFYNLLELLPQLNLVTYHNNERQTPSNKDLGLVEDNIGESYYSESTLVSLAQNTLSPGKLRFANR
jgi:hypothetical protein